MMLTTFEQVDAVAATLAPLLEQFEWFYGVGVEREADRYLLSVRVDQETSLEMARLESSSLLELANVEIRFRHQKMATSFGSGVGLVSSSNGW